MAHGNIGASGFVSGKTLAACSDTTPFLPGQVGKVTSFPGDQGGVNTKTLSGIYQYVQRTAGDTVAMVQGSVLFWADHDDFVVTDDPALSVGAAAQNFPAGVALGTLPAAGKYGWIQVGGIAPIKTGASVETVGFPLIVSAVTPGAAVLQAATTLADAFKPVIAKVITTNTAAGTLQARLQLNRNGW